MTWNRLPLAVLLAVSTLGGCGSRDESLPQREKGPLALEGAWVSRHLFPTGAAIRFNPDGRYECWASSLTTPHVTGPVWGKWAWHGSVLELRPHGDLVTVLKYGLCTRQGETAILPDYARVDDDPVAGTCVRKADENALLFRSGDFDGRDPFKGLPH